MFNDDDEREVRRLHDVLRVAYRAGYLAAFADVAPEWSGYGWVGEASDMWSVAGQRYGSGWWPVDGQSELRACVRTREMCRLIDADGAIGLVAYLVQGLRALHRSSHER